MEAALELFYTHAPAESGKGSAWSRPEAKKTLMLHYIFVTALLLEDCQLGPAQVGPHHLPSMMLRLVYSATARLLSPKPPHPAPQAA